MSKDRSKPFLTFHAVTFTYDNAPDPLLKTVSPHAAPGWTGVIGANGTGKTTLLKLAAGILTPVEGSIDMPYNAIYCPQRTDQIPEKLNELIPATTKSARIIKSQLGIEANWSGAQRWLTLSHGERKRAQIAVALWLEPELLAIDEPTNHLDSEARSMVENALHSFKGIGLLVSHDRHLLDSLCYQCLFLAPPRLEQRRGGYSQGIAAQRDEEHHAWNLRQQKKQAVKKLHKETQRRNKLASQSHKRRSKRGLAKKDHDAREKIDRARLTGKDGVGGKLYRQMQSRLNQAYQDLENLGVTKHDQTGIWLPASLSKRDFLLSLPPGSLALGEKKRLDYPELVVKPGDSIAITGANGSGKSTLIRFLVQRLTTPAEHYIYIPQEVEAGRSHDLLRQARQLPGEKLGHLMTVISRLGSRPHRLLESMAPSPGETRKLLLAMGITRESHIIIMDEPTNHMDLPSTECLEQALADSPCCLILVSHDRVFLEKLTEKRWDIVKESNSPGRYTLKTTE